jgi:hypothetical protein
VKLRFKILKVPLKRHFQLLFLAIGCIHLVGGPYAVVQLYAWANMLVSYTQESSFSNAVVDTFSGEKPCCLCKKIAEAKKSDPKNQDTETVQLSQKLFQDLIAPSISHLHDHFYSPLPPTDFPAVADAIDHLANEPLAPPPRA